MLSFFFIFKVKCFFIFKNGTFLSADQGGTSDSNLIIKTTEEDASNFLAKKIRSINIVELRSLGHPITINENNKMIFARDTEKVKTLFILEKLVKKNKFKIKPIVNLCLTMTSETDSTIEVQPCKENSPEQEFSMTGGDLNTPTSMRRGADGMAKVESPKEINRRRVTL